MAKKHQNPVISPLHKGRIIFVIIISLVLVAGIAAFETYNASVVADALI